MGLYGFRVARSYQLQLGEALPADVVKAMQNVTRPGYKLTGWNIEWETGSQKIDLDDFVADQSYYYNDVVRKYKEEPYKDRQYHYIARKPSGSCATR